MDSKNSPTKHFINNSSSSENKVKVIYEHKGDYLLLHYDANDGPDQQQLSDNDNI